MKCDQLTKCISEANFYMDKALQACRGPKNQVSYTSLASSADRVAWLMNRVAELAKERSAPNNLREPYE